MKLYRNRDVVPVANFGLYATLIADAFPLDTSLLFTLRLVQ